MYPLLTTPLKTFKEQLRYLCESSQIYYVPPPGMINFPPFLCFLSMSLHFSWPLVCVCVINGLFYWTVAHGGSSLFAGREHWDLLPGVNGKPEPEP